MGPCRATNYFFNRPFFLNERMPPEKKNPIYLPLLVFIATCLRERWPERYKDRTNLDIFYELCEYQKQPLCWYVDGGKTYRPTKYKECELPEPEVSLEGYIATIEALLTVQRAVRKKPVRLPAGMLDEGDDVSRASSDSEDTQ